MKALLRSAIVAGVLVTLIGLTGSGLSSADNDPLTGKTFADAKQRITNWHAAPVVATVVGGTVPMDDCIVTSWRRSSYVKHDNFDHEAQILFSLNCTAKVATAGTPGNSLASPAGRSEKAAEDKADRINSKPKWCAENLDQCASFCNKHEGLCSEEITALLS